MSKELDEIIERWAAPLVLIDGVLYRCRGPAPKKKPPRETKITINGRELKPGDDPLKLLRRKPVRKVKRPVESLAAQEMFDEAERIMEEREKA